MPQSLSFGFSLSSAVRKSLRVALSALGLLLFTVQSDARTNRQLPQKPAPGSQITQVITPLELDKVIERELAGGQKHGYQITLSEGQYARVSVDPQGIDLAIRMFGLDGKQIAVFDSETLVMSLWAVSDQVTRELMTGYYADLKKGLGRGEALRQVQLGMLKRRNRQHPFYWASFIQAGEWANLEGKR
jgi:CHAT domain-containing protein